MVDALSPDAGFHASSELQRAVLSQLLARVRREQFETWFRSLRVTRADDREMEFSVTSQFVRDWIQKHHLPTLQDVANGDGRRRRIVLGLRNEDGWDSLAALGLEATVRPTELRGPANTGAAHAGELPRLTPNSAGNGSLGGSLDRRVQLNPNNTFDKFVVGSCNRLAHASALAAGENPGSAYNPLFVHGNVGLGKTHLLQALCHTVMKRDPDARVLYLSCEDFTNTFINAIQTGSLDDFRNIHRKVDVLVIDDVQFLADKEKTQEEFFHTFNSLYDAQKQIVMSSDRSPVAMSSLEERLVSRF
jgi:chromosomal replication initiator protein